MLFFLKYVRTTVIVFGVVDDIGVISVLFFLSSQSFNTDQSMI